MCAQSVLPVISRFAEPGTLHVFEQALDVAWKSLYEQAIDSRTSAVRGSLSEAQESACDDSNKPAYEVMIGLSILAYALDALLGHDSARSASDACTAAAEYYSGYDNVLARGNQPQIIDPSNPPAAGRLESLQRAAQFWSIERLSGGSEPLSEFVEPIRVSAGELASELNSVLPEYARRRGWKENLADPR